MDFVVSPSEVGTVYAKLLVREKATKNLLMLLPTCDDVDVFLVHQSATLLSTRMSDLGLCRCFLFGSLITHRKSLHENMIVECSRLLVVIRSRDLVCSCFRVVSLMARGHST